LPYSDWAGFCYNELGWTRYEFWQSTVYDVVTAIIYFNKKNSNKKYNSIRKELLEVEKNMKIKGFI
jgi:hypothetical protein